ncbi:hypothetical protein TNCV_3709261 [Trichonephila clavipes]|nr:hypothetical protein TNCV_3709261 [Trichonephila clavipes]
MLQDRIIPSLADKHLLERTIFLCRMALPPILLEQREKISCAGRLVMIVCSAATFIMLGLPGPQISVRAIIGFWGYLKSQVYRDRPTSLGMLKDNIRLQCLTITPDML